MIAIIIIIAAVVLDRIFKLIAVTGIKPKGEIVVLKDIFHLTYVENKGAAFGILSNQRWLFIIATIIMVLLLSYAVYKKMIAGKLGVFCTALIIGGGIGNLIDRIFKGYVVDFIDLKLIYFICPAIFNVADMCVVIGTILLAVWLLFLGGEINVGKKSTESSDGRSKA